MLPVSTPDPDAPQSPEVSTHPISQIKTLIAEAKHAIWQCEGPEVLEQMLSTIAGRIAELPVLGNPQAIAPVTQQFLSLIETKPAHEPNGQSVLVMVKLLGYTPEFLKIYGRALSKEVLDQIIEFMARDPLMMADLKSSRMVCQLARRGASQAFVSLLDRMLSLKSEAAGPSLLEALSVYLSDDDCDAAEACRLILSHKEYLWTIPDYKARTVGGAGVGFLTSKAALTLFQHGEVDLARDLARVMCKQASDPNHFYYLAQMDEAPPNQYFNDRFFKCHIFAEDVLYSIQNVELDLPIYGLAAKKNDGRMMGQIIEGLSKLQLDSEVQQDRMIDIMQALSDDHPVNRNWLVKSEVSRDLLMRVHSLRDTVFAGDLGL